EIGMLLKSIKLMRKELKNWSKTKQTDTPLYLFPTKSYIKKEPYGTVLIIGPFNYPVQLVFEPLIGAIAAGNTAIVKPSELTPHVAIVIRDIIEDTFDETYVSVVEGGIEETQTLLSLPFDYIFFTGSEKVGKIVYEAAARKLIPVTLELGGKSPVIVDDTANIKVASERISFGKFTNAGQTCVAPNYILVQRKVKNDLIKALKKTITEFYGENIEKSPDFGRIVNQKHFNRLNDLIQIHKDNVVFGGNSSKEDLYIEPTLLDNITNDNKIMKEEIFGPILPIITYDNFDEVLEIIQSKSKPLSLYLFSEDENMTHRVLEELSFGGGAINDTLMHLANPNLPFGGVGSSGIGQYHGKYSFDTFSHMKSYTFKSTRLESSLFFPPYKGKFKYIKTFFKN
ncbi:aldehyde dehydrogenase, partial [Staphylococcus epidermidis]|nr:aldehyde dehydrogenase [Staphylococcus epidermidis]